MKRAMRIAANFATRRPMAALVRRILEFDGNGALLAVENGSVMKRSWPNASPTTRHRSCPMFPFQSMPARRSAARPKSTLSPSPNSLSPVDEVFNLHDLGAGPRRQCSQARTRAIADGAGIEIMAFFPASLGKERARRPERQPEEQEICD